MNYWRRTRRNTLVSTIRKGFTFTLYAIAYLPLFLAGILLSSGFVEIISRPVWFRELPSLESVGMFLLSLAILGFLFKKLYKKQHRILMIYSISISFALILVTITPIRGLLTLNSYVTSILGSDVSAVTHLFGRFNRITPWHAQLSEGDELFQFNPNDDGLTELASRLAFMHSEYASQSERHLTRANQWWGVWSRQLKERDKGNVMNVFRSHYLELWRTKYPFYFEALSGYETIGYLNKRDILLSLAEAEYHYHGIGGTVNKEQAKILFEKAAIFDLPPVVNKLNTYFPEEVIFKSRYRDSVIDWEMNFPKLSKKWRNGYGFDHFFSLEM